MKDRSRGLNRLKNRSGKCEGPGEGGQRGKEPEWEMRRTGRGGGVDGVKNRSGKCEGPGQRGGDQWLFEKKSFF